MSPVTVEVPALPVGWSRISGSGIHLVLARPFDHPLVAQLRAILPADRSPGHDLLDDLLDVLLRAGVRALPDFVAVHEVDPVRLVVRGAPVAEVTVNGEVRPIVSGGARTWADVEVSGNVELVSLRLPPASAVHALPSWPDEAPMAGVTGPDADGHEVLPSYDDLFGSTQCAMAFHAEDELVSPPPSAEAAPLPPPPSPPPPVASDLTLPAPTDGSAPVQGGPGVSVVPVPADVAAPVQPGQPALAGHPAYPRVDDQDHDAARPALGVLRLSSGDVVSLDRGVLLGRAPKVSGDPTGPQRPHVLRLASPDNDISRNHAEVLLAGRQVIVRDLGSTNGTTVALPGQEPIRLRPNDQQVIEPGTVVTLADEISLTYEVEA